MTAAFDTQRLARNLREKGKLTPEQAEGFSDAGPRRCRRTSQRRSIFAGLRLEAKIEASQAEFTKWLFGTIGFQTLAILGTLLALLPAGGR